MSNTSFKVALIMGSDSDWPVMEAAWNTLKDFGVSCEKKVVSAHRTPDDMAQYAKEAMNRGLKIIIAGAGGAAHLPGMVASYTNLPVIGVPIKTQALEGLDSLLSILQMPKGVPVATVAVDNSQNAALLAVRILALSEPNLMKKIQNYQKEMAEKSRQKKI